MNRYKRQLSLPEIGTSGQEKLCFARVLLVGVGGLGSPIALYLAAAGVGTLGLVDDDVVSLSNLQRQVLYSEVEVGRQKVLCAAQRLKGLNSTTTVHTYPTRLTAENASALISDYDIVVDGCDNYATRYLISDTCKEQGKPYVYGAIQGFEGQAAVLCHGADGKSYRDLYPEEENLQQESTSLSAEKTTPPASEAEKPVIGLTPAIVGSVQANEVLKLICGYGEPLTDRLWTIDLRTMQSYTLFI